MFEYHLTLPNTGRGGRRYHPGVFGRLRYSNTVGGPPTCVQPPYLPSCSPTCVRISSASPSLPSYGFEYLPPARPSPPTASNIFRQPVPPLLRLRISSASPFRQPVPPTASNIFRQPVPPLLRLRISSASPPTFSPPHNRHTASTLMFVSSGLPGHSLEVPQPLPS